MYRPIHSKVQTVLQILLIALLLILFRLWHLCFLQKEEKLQAALLPQRKTILEPALRGTIEDRKGQKLATNRIAYKAILYYNQLSQIPTVAWKDDRKKKYYPRREYVENLCAMLAKELALQPKRLADLIFSKAAMVPHIPFTIKENLTEKEYYRLRMLERDWIGLHAEKKAERFYPLGKTGADFLGYMGAIGSKEYLSIAEEIRQLEAYFEDMERGENVRALEVLDYEEAKNRLRELKERAYTLNDSIGKAGIEKSFEEDLRGFFGFKIFEMDVKGNFLQEKASHPPTAGRKVTLTISSELQEYAESLLAEREREKNPLKPWIKGGAIIALQPTTGEILAFASYPRLNPNDFICKNPTSLNHWLENDAHIAGLWDGEISLTRELYHPKRKFYEESLPLTWDNYLHFILPPDSDIWGALLEISTVKKAIHLQEEFEKLLFHSKEKDPMRVVEPLLPSIKNPADKLFVIDLCRLCVYSPAFSDELIERIGSMSLSDYREKCKAALHYEKQIKKEAAEHFHDHEFQTWRENNQKGFLKEIRAKEKEAKTYARPYIDYLDKKERELFEEYYRDNRLQFLARGNLDLEFLRTVRSFQELSRPLYYKKGVEKDLAAAFYPSVGFGYGRSFAFRQATTQGSIFKLITAYAALKQRLERAFPNTLAEMNPLTMIDEVYINGDTFYVGRSEQHVPYPRIYKGGRLPKSLNSHIGKIDLFSALEQSSNPYFAILASDYLKDPRDLLNAAKEFGYGEKTGIDLPGEITGSLPGDILENKTGLYSFAIGQHTLVVTPLQTAVMLAAIANKGTLFKPKIVSSLIGKRPLPLTGFSSFSENFPYQKDLLIHQLLPQEEDTIITFPSISRKEIFLPELLRLSLLEGMHRVVSGNRGVARSQGIKQFRNDPKLLEEYERWKDQFIGKSSTAEITANLYKNPSSKARMYKDVWFGAISFTEANFLKATPELVIIVYLRYGDSGKDAVPLAFKMAKKYKELFPSLDSHQNK